MKDEILKEIKNMSGSLLGIGIDDEDMLDYIEKNNNIDLCYILSNVKKSKTNKKFKLFKKGKGKTVNIKKLKKYFHKKSLDNILCDYNIIKKFNRSFISNSVYINKGKLYIYGNIEELDKLKEKYERYTDDITINKNNKSFIIIINNKNAKTNIFKDNFYKIKDLLSDSLDSLTEFLTN